MSEERPDHDSPEQVELRKGQGDPVVMYLVVRSSLGMEAGKVAAQVGHAVGMLDRLFFRHQLVLAKGLDGHHSRSEYKRLEAMVHLSDDEMAMFELWDRTSFRKVVLRADDKEWEKLKASGLRHVVVRDAGLTEVDPGSETVLGLWPMLRSSAPKIVRKLQVLKGATC